METQFCSNAGFSSASNSTKLQKNCCSYFTDRKKRKSLPDQRHEEICDFVFFPHVRPETGRSETRLFKEPGGGVMSVKCQMETTPVFVTPPSWGLKIKQ